MSSAHIDQVRSSLLATLQDLRDREKPMDVDRARAIAQVAGVLVDSAKVEVDYLKVTHGDRSTFLERDQVSVTDRIPERLLQGDAPTAHNPFPAVTRHRLEG